MTKVKFSLTITDSLIKTYRLVLKDKIILFPSLILVFFLAILDSYFDLYSVSEKMTLYQYLLKFFISKILALFAMGVTIQMGISLLNHSKIHVKSALILTCNKFVHLFIITSIYLLPTAYLNYKFFSNIEISLSNWWIWLLLVFVVLASFILIFAPMLIMAKNQTSLQAFFESYFFVKQHFRNVLRQEILDAMDILTERERMIIKLRFGFDDGRPRTLEEVGRVYNVTRERIRQIEEKALRKLRHPARKTRLQSYRAPIRTSSQ